MTLLDVIVFADVHGVWNVATSKLIALCFYFCLCMYGCCSCFNYLILESSCVWYYKVSPEDLNCSRSVLFWCLHNLLVNVYKHPIADSHEMPFGQTAEECGRKNLSPDEGSWMWEYVINFFSFFGGCNEYINLLPLDFI